MARLKTYGFNYQLPIGWPLVPEDNYGHRQRFVIVATTSRQKAQALFQTVGVAITLGELTNYGYCDMGGHAAFVATAEPGKVFYAPADHRDEYVPVDPEWSRT